MAALLSGLRNSMRLQSMMRKPMGARNMSGHSMEHAYAETDKWKKISYVFIPSCVAYAVFVTVRHNAHHHEEDHDAPQYPFMKKRDKMMPWAASKMGMGSDCDLFDYTCSNKFKAMKAAEAAE